MLLIDSSIFDFLTQYQLTDLFQYIVAPQFSSNDFIREYIADILAI